MRSKDVADGQQVEIPAPCIIRTVGTQEDRETGEWKDPVKYKGSLVGKSARLRLKYDED